MFGDTVQRTTGSERFKNQHSSMKCWQFFEHGQAELPSNHQSCWDGLLVVRRDFAWTLCLSQHRRRPALYFFVNFVKDRRDKQYRRQRGNETRGLQSLSNQHPAVPEIGEWRQNKTKKHPNRKENRNRRELRLLYTVNKYSDFSSQFQLL